MAGKEQVVEEVGNVLLPNLVNKALVANDRVKYLMTLLQTARHHADHPDDKISTLMNERIACGIIDADLDTLVEQAAKESAGLYRIPHVARLHAQMLDNVRAMLAPFDLLDTAFDGGAARIQEEYEPRLASLVTAAPRFEHDLVAGSYLDQITSVQPASGDSLHVLVMNAHRDLNQLQLRMAEESIDGARAYGVSDSDRTFIAAFMRGVNRTRDLKFNHPGLDTTATRVGDRLVLQNDIGETDAHVLVVHVTPAEITVTYTDVHVQRLCFFQSVLQRFPIQWEDTRSRHSAKLAESFYYVCVGTLESGQESQACEYLEYLGSRLVFLIDWNRARKRLRKLAPKRVCMEVLTWAAENNLGHMAFLRLGGEHLVYNALQSPSRVTLPLGRQLADIIGAERAAEFLKFTLRTATEGLRARRSELLIRDQVRAELQRYFDTAHQGLLHLASSHAELVVELAMAARDCLLLMRDGDDPEYVSRAAQRAKKWEHLADGIVTRARSAPTEPVKTTGFVDLLRTGDDAADEIEESVFLLTLLKKVEADLDTDAEPLRKALLELAELLVRTAQEYVKAIENAKLVRRGGPRENMDDFLSAVDHIISLEHEIDDAHRLAKANALSLTVDYRQLSLYTNIAANFEAASDSMMRAALSLRDYTLAEVITR